MEIQVVRIKDNAVIPTRGSEYAAGYDLYAPFGNEKCLIIPAHQTVKIGTGLCMKIPDGYFGAIFARSGIATKRGLRPSNCVGIVDADYRGEIIVAVHNDTETAQDIQGGERIAQLVVLPFEQAEFCEVDKLDETERGTGGFGSTDGIPGQMHISEFIDG